MSESELTIHHNKKPVGPVLHRAFIHLFYQCISKH